MAISREMTATEANVLNYIKNYATNEMPITAVQLRNEFQCDKRSIENIIESLRVNFWASNSCKEEKAKWVLSS